MDPVDIKKCRVRDAKRGSSMAKPCAGCMELIVLVGIKKVVYSTANGFEEFVIKLKFPLLRAE